MFWKQLMWWGCLGLVAGTVWVVHLFSLDDLRGPAAASWVQAVGSILAIIVAIAVSAFQHSRDQAREEARDMKERTRVVSLIQQCAVDFRDVLYSGGLTDHQAKEAGYGGIDHASKEHLRDRILVIRRQLESFTPFQMPSPQAFRLLSRLQGRVDLILEDLADSERPNAGRPYVHFPWHAGYARELVEEIKFELRRIVNPDETPPWA